MLTRSMASARPSRSTRNPLAAIRAPRWRRLPKFMTICVYYLPVLACRTVRSDGKPVVRQTSTGIIDQIAATTADKRRLMVLAPVVIDKKGAFEHIPEQYQRAGFARVRVDGVVYALDEFPELDKNYKPPHRSRRRPLGQ